MNKSIAVAGTGYVGLSISVLLAQHNHVVAVDIIPEKIALINQKKSPIQDEYIEKYLSEKELDLTATSDGESAYADADFVVVATPTNYDSRKNHFDTSAVEAVLSLVTRVNPAATIVIKSTIPVGYTESIRKKFHNNNIISARNFSESPRPCTTIFTQAGSLSPVMSTPERQLILLQHFFRRVLLKKILTPCSWDIRKQKL